jgi:ketosteroid isomerase-like protein
MTMPTAPITISADGAKQDKQALFSIVKEMSESMTGAQSTRHWADDALWFDIPAFASKGVQPALKFFDRVFSSFRSCRVDILEVDTVVNGNMGVVCTVQRVNVVLKNGDTKLLLVRETDCFERRDGEWKLIHQHASVPSGGEWDGRILTAY